MSSEASAKAEALKAKGGTLEPEARGQEPAASSQGPERVICLKNFYLMPILEKKKPGIKLKIR
jgi:hypothetical protein